MTPRRLGSLLMAASVCLAATGSRAQSSSEVALSGRVVGASGRHEVRVVLWNAQDFLGTPVRELRFPAGAKLEYQFKIVPGEWAISAYEDRNDNGILDMGMFGPKEPSGFWRPFHAWRKPRFSDVASRVDGPIANADVVIK